MALSATAVLEVRTTGNDGNGAGFNAAGAGAGTDYSQSDTPQVSVTDAVTNGTTTVTSATANFTSLMVRNWLKVAGARYEVTAFTNSTTITVDRTIGAAAGQTLKLGGAMATLAEAAATVVPGNTVYVRASGGYSISSALAFPTAGTDGLPVAWIGYGTSRTDGQQAILTWAGAAGGVVATFSGADQIIRNFAIIGNANTDRGLVVTGTAARVWNCSATGCQLSGISLTGAEVHAHRCQVTASGSASAGTTGFAMGSSAIAYDCRSFSNTGNGFAASNADGQCVRCDAYLNSKSGYYCFGSGSLSLFNCVASANALDGWRFDSSSGFDRSAGYNCVFSTNTGYGVRALSVDYSAAVALGTAAWVNNAFYANGSGQRFQLPAGAGDITLTADPFVSAAVGDFTENAVAGGGLALMGAGYPGGYGLSSSPATQVGYLDVGSVQARATAATSGTLFSQSAPVIDETRFPDQISRGTVGGPSYSTNVTITGGGAEQRIGQWALPRYKWEINNSPKQPSEMQAIIDFFHARNGRLRGFRLKDWSDFAATDVALVPTGAPTCQLIKSYFSGAQTLVRNIYKPTATPAVTLKRNGVAFLAFSVDTTTGILTFTPDSTATITAITKAASAVVTTSATHPFVVGDVIYFSGIVGMTNLNGTVGTITAKTGTTFTVSVNSTSFSTYTSGGAAAKYVQPADLLSWSGNFDVPCRFDVDELRVSFDDPTSWSLDSVPIIELRG